MVLSQMKLNNTGEIDAILTDAAMAQRLAALGLLPGCHVRLLRRKIRGAVLVEYRGTFLAISHNIAQNISVTATERSA